MMTARRRTTSAPVGAAIRAGVEREASLEGGAPIVTLQPWWHSLARHVRMTGPFLRRAGTYRRNREQRLTALRRFAASHDWHVTGLTDDLSASYLMPPLIGARSAQAELTVTGDWQGRTALVASVLVQPASVAPARRQGRPRDVIVLLVVMHVGRNDRQLIASRSTGAIDVMGSAGSVDALLQPLRMLLDAAAGSGAFREGDTLKLHEGDVLLAHPIRPREAPLDLASRLALLTDVAGLLTSE
jgi:hypothetical protein